MHNAAKPRMGMHPAIGCFDHQMLLTRPAFDERNDACFDHWSRQTRKILLHIGTNFLVKFSPKRIIVRQVNKLGRISGKSHTIERNPGCPPIKPKGRAQTMQGALCNITVHDAPGYRVSKSLPGR